MKKKTYTLKYLKICKLFALGVVALAVGIAFATVSTSDYQVETKTEVMTTAEIQQRFIFAGVLGGIGAIFNFLVGLHENELDRIDAENGAERYDEW